MVIDTNNGALHRGRAHLSPQESKASAGAAQSATSAPSTNRAASSDSVSLSGQAQALRQLEENIKASSGVDTEKVAAIKQEIAEGRYQVDAGAIADSMLSDS